MLNTPEHIALRNSVSRFVDEVINPQVDAWEQAQIFPAHTLFKQMGELGLLGISKPTEFGGLGLDYSYTVAFAEELGRIRCGALPMAIGVQTDMATPALARHGSDELRREFLAPSIRGERVCCVGVTEPEAGSDVAGLRTSARRDGDDYVINGGKLWITNGMQADWICLLVNTSAGPAHRNKSLVVVPLDAPGVTRARKLEKLGMWASDTAQLFFDEVRVPQRYRIGAEGEGFALQMQQFQEERLFAAAISLKALELVVQATIDYTRQRKVFGSTVLQQQTVHFRLAELQTEVEALRALVYRTTAHYLLDRDDPEVVKLASMAKLKAGRLARELTDACLQFWGAMGYGWDSLVSRFHRDLRLTSIGGGADEVMLGIICKQLGIFPARSA